MIPAQIIRKKRDGQELTREEIREFVMGYVGGEIADYQMSAWLMAVFFKGMTKKETWALTETMLHSGVIADFTDVDGFKVDKHSTGGVGDKTSLIIGPLVAAAGVKVPMISGRGLGHTGGTLDKLESIPGFNTRLSLDTFKKQVTDLGVCFIGQTADICPADKKMYALRDVTGTVECIPLICASIMSKKLAEGIDGLVLDVKTGSGAFMKSRKESERLAKALMEIAQAAGKKVTALITDMNQPLGNAVGNALEVTECMDVLNGLGPADLRELSIELSAHMIVLGKKAKNIDSARKLAEEVLRSGEALKHFEKTVRQQGGRFPMSKAETTTSIKALRSGYVKAVEAEKIGLASLSLGAGRLKSDDVIDPAAGLILHKKIGDKVQKGEVLVTLYHGKSRSTEQARTMVLDAYELSAKKTKAPRLIYKVMQTKGKT
jgi:pyrimidine-nucleoside phosphorylase